jgi:hypothetical protein
MNECEVAAEALAISGAFVVNVDGQNQIIPFGGLPHFERLRLLQSQ